MKYFLGICLIVAVFAIVQADDTCTVDNKTFKVGETYAPLGKCLQYKCQGPDSFSALTCPEVQTLKPCKYIPEDTTKPYPQCCSRHEC